jgi:hypothetical protein
VGHVVSKGLLQEGRGCRPAERQSGWRSQATSKGGVKIVSALLKCPIRQPNQPASARRQPPPPSHLVVLQVCA